MLRVNKQETGAYGPAGVGLAEKGTEPAVALPT